jgi:hypothetical protein
MAHTVVRASHYAAKFRGRITKSGHRYNPAAYTAARYELGAQSQNKERAFRHELKYYINQRDYELLRTAVSSLLRRMKIQWTVVTISEACILMITGTAL